jgi:hypothetical protein
LRCGRLSKLSRCGVASLVDENVEDGDFEDGNFEDGDFEDEPCIFIW